MISSNLKTLGLFLSLAAGATSVGALAIAPAAAQSVGSGATVEARWDTALNTKNAEVGEPVKLTITSPSSLAGGVIHAHVSRVRAAGQGRTAILGINTDYIAFSNGQTANFNASLESSGAKSENTTAQKAIGSGAGAAVGSQTVGRLLGGTLGSVVGIVGGAAGGYAYANNKKPNLYVDHGFIATFVTASPVYVRRAASHY